MAELTKPKEEKKASFKYFAGEQRTPEWYKLRIGKVTASRLGDWLAVSKAKGKEGTPLAKRKDYELELMYERQFDVAYDNFVSEAMEDGINLEGFAVEQYELIKKVKVAQVGAWYNENFCASPDGGVDDKGLVEVKVVRDNTFSEILVNGLLPSHKWWMQIQGQLWASKREWCDFIVINMNTKKVKIIRVLPDQEFFDWLEIAVPEPITVKRFDENNLYDFATTAPNTVEPSEKSNALKDF